MSSSPGARYRRYHRTVATLATISRENADTTRTINHGVTFMLAGAILVMKLK
jgi:hypothetical protein